MKVKFTRYFTAIEFTVLFSYAISLLIAVVIVASAASRLLRLSKRASDHSSFSALTRPGYSPNPLYRSTGTNYFIPEDDKLARGKFTEFAGPALLADFKRISDSAIDRDVDDIIYSVNPLPYNSSLGFTPLRSPPYFC
jgi:hypothetical protein